MTPRPLRIVLLAVALAATALNLPVPATAADPPARIALPPGFAISLYARVPGARSIVVVDTLGAVLVGTRDRYVYAVIDVDRDGRAERVDLVRDDIKVANGIAWRDGALYVAEQHRVVRFAATDLGALERARPQVLFDGLPDDPWHGWRYARFGPDGLLYVAVGSPCNICRVRGLEGTIVRLRPEGGRPEIFASGVRNSVGFDFQPGTGHLFFTDNGADNMGDDSPPDELNHAPSKGLWFGFPYFGGGRDRTGEFRARPLPAVPAFPVVDFNAHVAAIGVSFVRGPMFPEEYRGDAFVAQHGSWNRTVPDGYRVMRVRFDAGTGLPKSREPFATGWLVGDEAWGRPVDVKFMTDGSMLVSDDRLGAIYRITYTAP